MSVVTFEKSTHPDFVINIIIMSTQWTKPHDINQYCTINHLIDLLVLYMRLWVDNDVATVVLMETISLVSSMSSP